MSVTIKIEITFPFAIELTREEEKMAVLLADRICRRYEADHPDRTMWPAGIGCKPTYIPMTAEEEKERGPEFDDSVLNIECAERENYQYPCTKCGKPQGDHKHCIIDPAAGDCEFSAKQ